MSEPIYATLTVGGRIERTVFKELLEVADREGCRIGTEEEPIDADEHSTDGGIKEVVEALGSFDFVDSMANWGTFPELEKFCRQHEIAFDRKSDGQAQYNPEALSFRPKQKDFLQNTDSSGNAVIGVQEVEQLLKKAKRVRKPGGWAQVFEKALKVYAVPELPKLEVYDAGN